MKLIMLALALLACDPTKRQATPEEYAVKFASDLGYEVIGKTCTETDSDWDGYVSCSVRVKNDGPLLSLQCGNGYSTAGCKQTAAKVTVRP